MTLMQVGYRIPQGNKWKAYLTPSTLTVCPALDPPLNLAHMS